MIQLRFHPKEKYFPTDNKFEESEYTIYKSEQNELYSYQGEKYKAELYEIYYKENGAIGLGKSFFPKSKFLGYHLIDVERLIFLRDLLDNSIKFVHFSAHRDEGKWVPYSSCEKTTFGDLIVYVALSSHANYPHAGCWYRIYGFANDLCSKDGESHLPRIQEANKTYSVPNKEPRSDFCQRFFYH